VIRGHLVSKAAIRLARKVGGSERDEWVRAMAAEWDALDRGKTSWALGCLVAAVRDRLRREWRFLAALVLAVPAAYLCNGILMTLVPPTLNEDGAPTSAWIAAYMFGPLAVPLLLGALFPSRGGTAGILASAAFLFTPMLAPMVLAGESPLEVAEFLVDKMGAALAVYPLALGAWYAAGRLGAGLVQRWRVAA
jgi:hypothetical protein